MYNPQGVNRKSNGRESDIVEKIVSGVSIHIFFSQLSHLL